MDGEFVYAELEKVRQRWRLGGSEPGWYCVPADVREWMIEDASVLSPVDVTAVTYAGAPVHAGPGFGAGL